MMGNAHTWSISLLMNLSSADEFSSKRDDLWFLLSIIAYQSNFLFPILLDLDGNKILAELC